ncbi:helix-turn-helix domain-containing protein [Halalkalibacter sp. AB-rgal2]|uniref:helix-turn-helix domain-containing protein n=1 Tax=Halalkalibacter sp. AB-rgal2 TaxID=3242695 RepID=UPI00359F0F0D
MNIFASRLKKAREEFKKNDSRWTQEFVSKKIGVARSSYTSYENGSKQPPLETVNKLADLLEVSADYLLGRTDTESIETEEQRLERKVDEALMDPETEVFLKDYLSAPEKKREDVRNYLKFLIQQEELDKNK